MRCDKCGEPGAKHYTISDGENTWAVDLDDQHAKPLLALANLGRITSATESRRGSTGAAKIVESRVRHPPEAPHYQDGHGRGGRP